MSYFCRLIPCRSICSALRASRQLPRVVSANRLFCSGDLSEPNKPFIPIASEPEESFGRQFSSTGGLPKATEDDSNLSVFVGNLSFDIDEDGLSAFFEEHGLTATCRVITAGRRSKGYGYADMSSKEDFEKALMLAGTECYGRELRINPANSRPRESSAPRGGACREGGRVGFSGSRERQQNPPNSSLIVINLSYDTTADSLADAFDGCSNAKVIFDRDSGQSRGFGFVDFDDVDTAQKVLSEMSGTSIDGREVRLDFARSDGGGASRGGGGGRGGFRGGDRGGGFRGGR